MNRCKICGGFLSMQRLWTQTGTETVEERWVTRQCKRCNPDPEYSEGAKRLIAKAEEENRRREIEEMRNLLAAMKEDDERERTNDKQRRSDFRPHLRREQ